MAAAESAKEVIKLGKLIMEMRLKQGVLIFIVIAIVLYICLRTKSWIAE